MRMRKKKWVNNYNKEHSELIIDKSIKKINSIFPENNDLNIEIGCGKGKFIIENSLLFPDKIFIAIEKDITALSIGLRNYVEKISDKKTNLIFWNGFAENIDDFFDKKCVSIIYLNFSDPWPKNKNKKRRLTHISFLKKYHKILKNQGIVEIKTDSTVLYEFTLNEIRSSNYFEIIFYTDNMYDNELLIKNNIQTEYEKKFISSGIAIKKIILRKNN